MSIIDQLSLSKSGPSAFSKVAVNASNDLFSTLLGSEILASINSHDDFTKHQMKSDYSQPYDRHRRGSLEFNDQAQDEIHSVKEPAPYQDNDSYNYDQITENDSIEREPTVPNATERNDNNEHNDGHSTKTVREDKEYVTGNYNKDNRAGSSQGIIEVDNGVLTTADNEVGSSKIIGRHIISTSSSDSTVVNTLSLTNQETSDKSQPAVITSSTP